MKRIIVGGLGLVLAFCLSCYGVTYTGGDCAPANLIHRWSFNDDFVDSVGGLTAASVGTSFADHAIRTTGGGRAASYVILNPDALPKNSPFTIEIFATPRKIYSWSRIFSFGKGSPTSSPKDNFFMSWTREDRQDWETVYLLYGGAVLFDK